MMSVTTIRATHLNDKTARTYLAYLNRVSFGSHCNLLISYIA
jgi:hypothetical protein